MIPRLLFALACAVASPVVAQVTDQPSAAESTEGIKLHVARSGNEVMISWELPPLEIKQFEIFRHTQREANGRSRAGAVRTSPAIFLDQVPDQTVTYWYWLKITLGNGQVVNIGPVATPDAAVWTP